MFKRLTILSILALIFTTNIYAYVDMSMVSARANDLNMSVSDYAYAMAISGSLCGSMLGLFLWKTK
jgi:hypothetical protein